MLSVSAMSASLQALLRTRGSSPSSIFFSFLCLCYHLADECEEQYRSEDISEDGGDRLGLDREEDVGDSHERDQYVRDDHLH